MSQYSLSTTDPLRKGSREQARKIRLPWKVDNGVRKRQLYDVGAASLIFDAGTVDTRLSTRSRASSKRFWSRKHTLDGGDDATTTPTQDEFGSATAVLGGTIFESPPVSRAGTADTMEMGGKLSGEHFATSDTSPHTPTLAKSQRGWKMPSPLSASPRWASKRPADVDDETIQQPVTPTTPSALTRVFGIFSRR